MLLDRLIASYCAPHRTHGSKPQGMLARDFDVLRHARDGEVDISSMTGIEDAKMLSCGDIEPFERLAYVDAE